MIVDELVTIFTIDWRGEGDLRRFQQGMKQAERSATSFTDGIIGMGTRIGPVFAALGAAITTGLVGQLAQTGMAFEDQLTEIEKKAGATAEQMAKIKSEILDLSTSGEVASPMEEISAAYERGAAAGLPLEDLREFALLSTKAADAFGMTAEEVGNAFAGFDKVLGVPRAELEKVADLINHLADSGIADESEIVSFMDSAGAMAKTIGLSVGETAALGAALANLKVPAGEAATAMNAILTKVVAPDAMSKAGRAEFAALVGSTEDFARSLNEDADQAIVGLLDRLKDLDKASRAQAISKIFGMEHVDVVSQMVAGIDEVKRNLHEAGEETLWLGSLQKSYEKKLDDTSSRLRIFMNNLKAFFSEISLAGLPVLNRALDTLSDFFRHLRSNGTIESMSRGFRSMLDGVAAVAQGAYRIGRGFYYAADGLLDLTSRLTGLSKGMTAVGWGAGLVASTALGRNAMMGIARRVPMVAALLVLEDILTGLDGGDSYLGSLEGGQAAIDGLRESLEEYHAAIDSWAETVNSLFSIEGSDGKQFEALIEGLKGFAEGEFVRFFEDMAEGVRSLTTAIQTIEGVLKNPTAAWEGFANAAIAQMDRILAYLDGRFGGALTAMGLLMPDMVAPEPVIGQNGKPLEQGGLAEKGARRPVTWEESTIGRIFQPDPSDPATARVDQAFKDTAGTGIAQTWWDIEAAIMNAIKLIPSMMSGALTSSNLSSIQTVAEGHLKVDGILSPAAQAQSAVDQLGRGVTARADLDISPLLSKVATADAALDRLESRSRVSVGGGNNRQIATRPAVAASAGQR